MEEWGLPPPHPGSKTAWNLRGCGPRIPLCWRGSDANGGVQGKRGGGPISQRVFQGLFREHPGDGRLRRAAARLDPCALRCFLEGFQVEVLDNLLDLFVLHCDHQGDRIAGSGIINVAGPGRDFTGGAGPGPRTPSSGRWRGPSRTPSGPSPRQGSRLPSPAGRALQPHSRAPTGRGSPCPRV